ncbi:DUF1707 SHOCT-like domain-containing protein [Nocardioides ochotonae]|uniref:DUF1707 SHOCT-like domain-containing protein n=1 Tax=Nocardioides ochotonae TaxID=2685869 RepID=UPI0014075A03|nr:DUF1707 domain-containing protein [Nocardioides ochotonae]
MSTDDPWAGFSLDPRLPQHAALRASDGDRAAVQQLLAQAYAEGRLDHDELEERSAAADALKTYAEIPALVLDLVPITVTVKSGLRVPMRVEDVRREAARRYEADRRAAILAFIGPTLICWAVWVATSFGSGHFEPYFPWPLIVMAATLVNLLRTTVGRHDRIEEHVRRIERERAKALKRQRRGLPPGAY